MNREDLKKYIGVTGYSMGQVEKDYFQHIVLGGISRKMGAALVFKGGTALQKTGIVRRFSEDLDFTARADFSLDALVGAALGVIRSYNFQAEADERVDEERTAGFRLKIQGPLYRNRRAICTIRIEISRRERAILEPERKELAPPYTDILPYVMDVMRGEEIMAEKVRAVYTRSKARDLYDIYKLVERKIPLNADMVNKKISYCRLKFDARTFIEKCEKLSHDWDNELLPLVEALIPYQTAFDAVMKAIPTE